MPLCKPHCFRNSVALTVKTPASAEPVISPPTKLGGSWPENCTRKLCCHYHPHKALHTATLLLSCSPHSDTYRCRKCTANQSAFDEPPFQSTEMWRLVCWQTCKKVKTSVRRNKANVRAAKQRFEKQSRCTSHKAKVWTKRKSTTHKANVKSITRSQVTVYFIFVTNKCGALHAPEYTYRIEGALQYRTSCSSNTH